MTPSALSDVSVCKIKGTEKSGVWTSMSWHNAVFNFSKLLIVTGDHLITPVSCPRKVFVNRAASYTKCSMNCL